MAKRALGALFALAAAAAFVVAIVMPAWWSGHPIVDGRPISAKDVHVGLLGAEGCNTGGDGSCEAVEIGGTLKLASYAELAAIALAALLAFLVAIAAWRIADNRKGLARASMITTLLAAGGGVVVVMLGPAIKASSSVEVPLGWGLFVFAGALVLSLIAATITRGIDSEPLRLKPSNAPLFPPAQTDIRQIIQSTTAEPAPRDSASLFNAAPHLRPLYDPTNAGISPAPVAPHMPARAPTPLPRDQIEHLTGKPVGIQRLNAPPPAHELDWSAPPTQTPAPQSSMDAPHGSAMGAPSYGSSSSGPLSAPFGTSTGAPPSPIGAPRSKPLSAPPPPPPGSQSSSRTAAMGAQPPPKSPASQGSSRNAAPPTSPPSQGSSRNAAPPTSPPSQSSSRNAAPPTSPPSQSSSRNAAPTIAARAAALPARNASPSSPPPLRPTVPSPGPRAKPPTGAPTRDKPSTTPPVTRPSAAAARAKPPTTTATPGASTSPWSRDTGGQQPRARTISNPGATPPPERHSSSAVARAADAAQSDAAQSGPRPSQPTLAHAVPPMPRASTDSDDRLDLGMRETEHHTAVEIDHEAKARAQHAHANRRATEDVRTGGNRTVGDVTDANVSTAIDEQPVESTDIGAAPMPPPGLRVPAPQSEQVTVARISALVPASAVGDEPAFDANATIEQNPKVDLNATMSDPNTPVPTLSRGPTSPLSGETPPPTRSNVPLSTAPSSLPPPKVTNAVPSGPTPACPQCESPMAWVEEHLRFYCRSCRMYF